MDLQIVTKITNLTTKYLKDIALEQLISSGFEIINDSNFISNVELSDFIHKDIRDDKVYFLF